jgi:pyrroline-5-carboxylate reductase
MNTVGFIGSGNIAFALAKSFMKSNLVSEIILSDKNEDRLKLMKENGFAISNNLGVLNCEIVFICVKPNAVNLVLDEIKNHVKDQIIISVAAGISIGEIEKIIPNARIFRVMPNVLSLVNEMSSAYSYNKNCDEQDINIVDALLNDVGFSVHVDEDKIDVVTALSGSSPAYFAYLLKAFIDISIENGLSEEDTKNLISTVLIGTGKYLRDKKKDPDDLINMIKTPNGVTEAGINSMEKEKILEIMKNVFQESVNKCKQIK